MFDSVARRHLLIGTLAIAFLVAAAWYFEGRDFEAWPWAGRGVLVNVGGAFVSAVVGLMLGYTQVPGSMMILAEALWPGLKTSEEFEKKVLLVALPVGMACLVVGANMVVAAGRLVGIVQRQGLHSQEEVARFVLACAVIVGAGASVVLMGKYFYYHSGPTKRFPSNRYQLGFLVLLAIGLAGMIVGFRAFASSGEWWIHVLPFSLIATSTIGLLVAGGDARLAAMLPGGKQGVLWRNRWFVAALLIAAWAGLEIGGKGSGGLRWLLGLDR